MNGNETAHYESPAWSFALDMPAHWLPAPPVPANSPYELIRFVSGDSKKSKNHLTIIFRETLIFLEGRDVVWSLRWHAEQRAKVLAPHGYRGFTGSPAAIQSRPAWRLDLQKPESWGVWNCRYYFVASGAFLYRVGFGAIDKEGMFPVFDRVAESFTTRA